jgi:type I restriction enzyme, S subunit
MTNELPQGWTETPLDSVVFFQEGPGLRRWQFGESGIPFLNIRTFENGRINRSKCQFVKAEEFKGKYEHFLLKEGDLVVSSSGTLGKVATVHAEDLPLMLNTSTIRFRARYPEALMQKFLRFYVQSNHFFTQNDSAKTGSAIFNYGPSHLKRMSITLPPLKEQKRIVEKVEQLLVRVNAARERLARAPAILKRFRQAILAAACSGSLTAEWREQHPGVEPAGELLLRIERLRRQRVKKDRRVAHLRSAPAESTDAQETTLNRELLGSWISCQVEQIATVCLGGTPSRKEQSYWDGEVPWVSSGEVANRRIGITREQITCEGLTNSNAKVYPKGTVLIAMIGEGKTRGQSAILDIDACTNQNVAGLVFEGGTVVPDFVWLWALSEYERNRAVGRGGAQPALNGEKVRALTLSLPPFEEQIEIVRRVVALFKLAGAIETRVASAITSSEKLTQAILVKAFRGELVPTEAELARREGRSYESATALLALIHRDRDRSKEVSGRAAHQEHRRWPKTTAKRTGGR